MSDTLQGGKKRPTIGLLIDWLGGRYQSLVWPGVVDAAEERDANLLIFSGRLLNDPHGFLAQSNQLYELISSKYLDGLVILSGNLCQYVRSAAFEKFCKRFAPLPVVSVSLEIPGMPNVLVDNESGMRAVMVHLIEEHGYRRIAFIAGPEYNEEAQQRLAIYKDELARHGIPFDPEMVAPGDFSYSGGAIAARILLDERGVKPEVIVAADDALAIGVLREARVRGWKIPIDFALTGFDDLSEVRFLSPTLTTVRQPFYEQSYTATMLLLDRIAGKPAPQRVVLPTQLVPRQSCGCLSRSVQLAGRGELPESSPRSAEDGARQIIVAVQDSLEQSFSGHVSQELILEWAAQTVNSLLADLEQTSSNHFIRTLDSLLHEAGVQRGEIGRWQDILSSLRKALLGQISDAEKRLRLENLLSQGRVLISNAAERLQAYQLQQLQYNYAVESEVDQSVLTTLDIMELKTLIGRTLTVLGIPSGFIVFSKGARYNPASLFLAFDQTGMLAADYPTPFDPRDGLVPSGFLPEARRFIFVVEALYFQNEQIGYGLFEMGARDGMIYATLRRQLSSALKGALLLQEHKQAQERIQSINDELVEYRQNLEKMVAQRTEQLEYLATHDPLTSLPNRMLFSDRLEHALAVARRSGKGGAILLIDLDDFKAINDAFSHNVGDEFLKIIAGRFTECLRESDTVARVGGDEYAVLLENIDHNNASLVAQKLNQALARPVMVGEAALVATASIGISMFPHDGREVQQLVKNADLAMYQAKETKNSFHFYDPKMTVKIEKQMELNTYMRQALQNNIFQLHYQPQVDGRSGRVIGLEALLRLPHPERKWIPPVEFIPLAERTGLITSIDEWVLRTAAGKMRELAEAKIDGLTVSVNISNRLLHQGGLTGLVAELLRNYALDPAMLEMEISEGSIFRDTDRTVQIMTRLKTLGLKLAIDDFGTGYASLNYLARFPLDRLKIDRSFTRRILHSKSVSAVVNGVVAIANSLGLGVVVEGVESMEQLAYFSQLGCHLIQGYYYSPAVAESELLGMLRQGFDPYIISD
jgi:diguanylate cyclase (GGDEF)-like protein